VSRLERTWGYMIWATFGALCFAFFAVLGIALFSHSYVPVVAP